MRAPTGASIRARRHAATTGVGLSASAWLPHYGALNLIYSPVERVDLGAEMLAGSRRNHDGTWGSATQTQLAATWRF